MLLNFELPSDAFVAPRPIFKGGRWKDRLTAKRKSRTPLSKEAITQEPILPDEPRPKRAKTQENTVGSTGFVSSLFTYNPASSNNITIEERKDDVQVEPSNAPLSDEISSFTSLGLSTVLANHLLRKLEIKAPTAVQRKAIQELCSSDTDAFIQAETGSGKTLAYLLPLLQRLMALSQKERDAGQEFNRESGLFAIVLAPTRELSKQISSVLDGLLSCCKWIVSGIVIGGEKKKSEKARLRKGVNILVATPGRLADHLDNTKVLDVSKVRWLVLDEGDRLMELGFEKDIRKIVSVLNLRSKKVQSRSISGLPERRTTVLCSATLKTDVEQLQSIALKEPVTISVDGAEQLSHDETKQTQQFFSAPAQLKQSYAIVPPKQRLVTLVATLKQSFRRKGSVMRCIVFISCADSVDFHFEILSQSSRPKSTKADEDETTVRYESQKKSHADKKAVTKASKISQGGSISETRTQANAQICSSRDNPEVQLFRLHGSLQQSTRTATLMAFSKCSQPAILVCTDVASRGLDLPHIDLVMEYDPPFSKDDHLHRIGRTARAGKDGRAMIFLMPGCEEGYIEILKEGRPHNLTRHTADGLLKKGFSPSSGVVSDRDWEDRATDWQMDSERWVLNDPKHLEQARRAFQSHVRAYTTHVAAERRVFDMQQLHLGHLAKAFALRDKPSSIRVPGLRPNQVDNARSKDSRKRKSEGTLDANFEKTAGEESDARTKMRAKLKALGGASEFNLG